MRILVGRMECVMMLSVLDYSVYESGMCHE